MSEEERQSILGDPLDRAPSEEEVDSGSPSGVGKEGRQGSQESSLEQSQSQEFREDDTGLGQPDPEPRSGASSVSPEEIQELRREEERFKRQLQEKLWEMERTGIGIPRAVYRTLAWAAVFLGALLGVFLLSQGLRFAEQVSVLSSPWNFIAGAAFALLMALILGVVIKLVAKFMVFKRLEQVDLKALKLLSQRRRFRQLAEQKKDEAKPVLINYLQDFQIKKQEAAGLGLDPEALNRVNNYRQSLLQKQGYTDSSSWIQEFEESFMHVLDRTARKRIRSYSRNVALGTAASPIRLVDQMIVLYSSLKLIRDLMQIYNLRPALGQSATILARSIIQAYLSGLIDEHAQTGLDTFGDFYQSIFGEISFTSGVSAATDATSRILPKVSEGALNGFFIWRLGKQAQKMLRPV